MPQHNGHDSLKVTTGWLDLSEEDVTYIIEALYGAILRYENIANTQHKEVSDAYRAKAHQGRELVTRISEQRERH